jgi:hypothetical protein
MAQLGALLGPALVQVQECALQMHCGFFCILDFVTPFSNALASACSLLNSFAYFYTFGMAPHQVCQNGLLLHGFYKTWYYLARWPTLSKRL